MKSLSSDLPDQYFISNFQNGEREAFKELFHRYKIKIYNLALKILKNREEAEEISQEVFIKAFSSLNKFQGRSEFSTWIYRIAYNLCQDKIKIIRRVNQFHDSDIDQKEILKLESNSNPEKILQLKEICIKCVDFSENFVPYNQRVVLTLKDAYGLPNKQIANILGCNVGTVKARLARARVKVKEFLMDTCEFINPQTTCKYLKEYKRKSLR
ncbi:MAG: hypothetical protein A3C43_04445 [Candidatus Schekmanbacteria bacterium RIFCSPHIGHO2_02_FULL_38_11]|uniref:RNA polymerase subunit sigma-24 n=1 Tax=Candidatus Schekmanbacteria bacterium RIFCSPLOWO2_12_FULL_38_15 TaxID=1817883 RepID=A0A1F7SM29_9BACT|nr:MAG: hypothetical protein A2043_01395 [Candidatus Schekmanbacteria bacterium GWA2_38_9]OGL48797.1 MAG: hypothetical protein A3C43_04445 [Candidatus Schekmanbacteria bacterium RIFCSPHIGHO2_02_FULL_38_11]OGL51036.1 MAG: hypothetical protein A3H37_11225 [Candidatus Schekmanbacteria bacterium RIFCSPLOWO2_02_FULL_38_14]OGL54835.1 MAG: hypothetical protein A3G31_01785 [Candidatus Schekmanbacteria bacterium RIFCSPLOWO2_12_FULL_38_15]